MDPLSIAASVIAILGAIKAASKAVSKCLKILHEVSRAPAELKNLCNEASTLRDVLNQIASIAEPLKIKYANYEDEIRRQIVISLQSHVSQAGNKLVELVELLQLCLRNPRPGGLEVLGSKQTQNRRRANVLLEEIRAIREHLTTGLTMLNLSTVTLTETGVRHLILNQNRAEQILLRLQDQVSVREPPLGRMLTIAHDAEFNHDSNNLGAQGSRAEEALICSSFESQGGSDVIGWSGNNNWVTPMSSQNMLLPKNAFSNSKHQRCLNWCSCVCHTRMHVTMSLPSGRLSVFSSGLPLITRPCNEHTCKGRPEPTIGMTFHFPIWFWSRFISISMKITPLCGPEINLKIPRVVGPGSSRLWVFAVDGNKEGIQDLFSKGAASPWDVNLYGSSALHYAVIHGHFELCEFLLNEGADAFLEDIFHNSPAYLVSEKILSNDLTSDKASDLALSFSNVDYLDTIQLGTLHKAALNLVSVSLKSSLDCSTSEINSQDSRGRTCLSWVTTRDDRESLQLLLQKQADANIPDLQGFFPIHYAKSLPCAKLLFQYGANLDSKTPMGFTPLQLFSELGRCDMIEWMVQAGADINAMEWFGSPLIYATRACQPESAACLIRLGANLNLATKEFGSTALHEAVCRNVHDILQQLFSCGADHTIKSYSNETILHDAARIGDTLTMEIISKANLSGLDPWAKDSAGKTAQDVFNERCKEGAAKDLEDAFKVLLESFSEITNPDPKEKVEVEEEEEEEEDEDIFLLLTLVILILILLLLLFLLLLLWVGYV